MVFLSGFRLGWGSAISQSPPGSPLPLNGPGFWVLVTPSPPKDPVARRVTEVSYFSNLWVATLLALPSPSIKNPLY